MLYRRALLATLPALLAGCATPPPAPPELLLRLPPAALGRRLAWAQQLQVQAGDRNFQFDVHGAVGLTDAAPDWFVGFGFGWQTGVPRMNSAESAPLTPRD